MILVNITLAEQDSSDILGCRDPLANNYNINATKDDGTCTYGYINKNNSKLLTYNLERL